MGKTLTNLTNGINAGIASLAVTTSAVFMGMNSYGLIRHDLNPNHLLTYGPGLIGIEVAATLAVGAIGIGLGLLSSDYLYQGIRDIQTKRRKDKKLLKNSN